MISTNANSLSNKTPLHTQVNAAVQIYDHNNILYATASGLITYDPQFGDYKGIVSSDKIVPPGPYSIKIIVDRHLRRLVPGIQNLAGDSTTNVTPIQVIAGDINRDNRLDILDYNTLIDCYSDLEPPVACDDPQKKADADINDDGSVGQTDYNLFLRELSTQPGE